MNTLDDDRWLQLPRNQIRRTSLKSTIDGPGSSAYAAEPSLNEGENKMPYRSSPRRFSLDSYGYPKNGNRNRSLVKILKTQAGKFSSRNSVTSGLDKNDNGFKRFFTQKRNLRRKEKLDTFTGMQNLSFDEKLTDCCDITRYFQHSMDKEPFASIIEGVTIAESGVIHNIGSYLLPREVVALAMASSTLCEGLRGCHIRLDWMKRTFLESELEHYFGCSKSRMTSWAITGAKIRPGRTNSNMWNVLHTRGLNRLLLSDVWEYVDLAPLNYCSKLETFDAGTSCTTINSITTLRNCDDLRYLYIRNCNNVTEASQFLPDHGNLRELSLYMCRNLTEIEKINRYRELRVLDMGGCLSLKSIAALKNCENLEQLSLADCSSIGTIDSLEGLSKLYHIDLTGCTRIRNFAPLNSILALKRVSLKRCDSGSIFPLIESLNEIIATEATVCLKGVALWQIIPLLPDLINMLDLEEFQLYSRYLGVNMNKTTFEAKCNAFEILAAVATQDTGGDSVILQHGALPAVLSCIQHGRGRLRENAVAALARMAHNRNSVPTIVDENAVEILVDLIQLDWETMTDLDKSDTGYKCHETTNEYAASALLLIALVEEERQRIVEASGIEALVKLLHEGSDGASVEAAGALWNLGATLEIGKHIVESGAVPALVQTLKTRPLSAKIQAAGALRNLAILNVNKIKLSEYGIITVLVEMMCSGNLDINDEEQLGLLVKIVATIRILSSNPVAQVEAARCGAIPPLVVLLRKHDEQLRRQASGALLALSFNEKNRNLIADARGIINLVRIVATDMSDATIMSAAGCLWNLAMNDDLERRIVKHDAIPALIRRLDSRSIEVVCKAAGALKNLSYQREHKEIVAANGGIPKLVELIKDPSSRALPYAVGALRLVASGRPETRKKIVNAGAIEYLVKLLALKDEQNDAVRLASGTLLHLADCHTEAMIKAGAVPHLIAMTKWEDAPLLVREEAAYILQRIALSPNNATQALRVERSAINRKRSSNELVLSRARGVPGDTYIKANNTIMFYSYSSVSCETFLNRGKVYYEISIDSVKGFPSFGWISKEFETGINHLYDCGVGFPGKNSASHDSWAIDGVNQRKWPTKASYGSRWQEGDVVTIAADLDAGVITFGLNGCYDAPMGVAFRDIFDSRNESFALAPALSGSHNTVVQVNFGEIPFRFPPPEIDYIGFYQASRTR